MVDFDYSNFPKSYVLSEYCKFIKKNKKKLKLAQSYETSISDTFFKCFYDGVHDTGGLAADAALSDGGGQEPASDRGGADGVRGHGAVRRAPVPGAA